MDQWYQTSELIPRHISIERFISASIVKMCQNQIFVTQIRNTCILFCRDRIPCQFIPVPFQVHLTSLEKYFNTLYYMRVSSKQTDSFKQKSLTLHGNNRIISLMGLNTK